MIHHFSFPTEILFGAGARNLAAGHLHDLGLRHPLVVTDRNISSLPVLAEFCHTLGSLKFSIFSDAIGAPSVAQVIDGVAAFKKQQSDCVIGFGGGVALDLAKAIAMMTAHEGNVLDYAWNSSAGKSLVNSLPYLIALPTTSGTGAELCRSCMISDDQTRMKHTIFSPKLLPRAVFADPELTVGLPADVTAATGMDALSHNIEAYLSSTYHPMCDSIALEGAHLAGRALAMAVHEPDNLQARADMMMAAMMGGVALQKDLGAVHSCAHALSTVCGIHYGLANALMFEPVMRFNFEAVPQKFAKLADITEANCTEDFVPWLRRLKRQVGIGSRLSMYGARGDQVPELVAVALADTSHRTNPRPCGADDFKQFFEQAM